MCELNLLQLKIHLFKLLNRQRIEIIELRNDQQGAKNVNNISQTWTQIAVQKCYL